MKYWQFYKSIKLQLVKVRKEKGSIKLMWRKRTCRLRYSYYKNINYLHSPERLEISQLFPADALVNSPQIEKARLISGIEQRLEQSLMALDTIADARVHLSYPIVVNSRSQTPMKASVIVFYHDEKQDIDEFKMGIKAFIKNAISELEPQYITVFLIHKISPPISSQPKKNTSGEYIIFIYYCFLS